MDRRPSTTSPAASRAAHHAIVGMEVTGGFLKEAQLEFVDGLNCIIGGRGTGKTTVLEFIRYVLGLIPEEKTAPARVRALRGLVQGNLDGGRVRLAVRTRHGMGYLAERGWDDAGQVFDERGEPTALSFNRDLVFNADVYSQNEIEEIARNPAFQLALIDKFIDEDVRRIDGEIRKVRRDLDHNAAELLRLDGEIADLHDVASEASSLDEKLKALQKASGPDAKAISAAHANKALREKERRTLEALRGDLEKVRSDIEATAAALVRRLEARIDDDVASGPNKVVFTAVVGHVHELTRMLERAAAKIGEQAGSAAAVVAEQERALATRHAKQEAEYRKLVAKSDEESGRAAERAQLEQRYAEAVTAGKEVELRQKERRDRAKERQALMKQVSALNNERFRLRDKVAARLTDALQPTIRVTIAQGAGRDGYRALLAEALKGQNLKYANLIDRIVESTIPREFADLVHQGADDVLAKRLKIDRSRASKVLAAFADSELAYQVEAVEQEDVPRIELLDGDEYKESAALSTGQRCTTILPILLLESERPLLIDQPEDNLDNAFIYETVVKSVRGAKGRRQLIFVTHNPNIPVLGDAERVFVLASDGKRGRIANVGNVDQVKDEIELLLEGGRDAFQRRMERYGH